MVERALARVDVGAVERNCARLRGLLTGGAELCAVATAGEAEDLRRHGIAGRILVMGALTREELRVALEADADVVAWREGFARAVADQAVPGARPPRVHVKLDTGMGRLGAKDPPTLLLYGHNDVQPPGNQAHRTTPPFVPSVRDGRI